MNWRALGGRERGTEKSIKLRTEPRPLNRPEGKPTGKNSPAKQPPKRDFSGVLIHPITRDATTEGRNEWKPTERFPNRSNLLVEGRERRKRTKDDSFEVPKSQPQKNRRDSAASGIKLQWQRISEGSGGKHAIGVPSRKRERINLHRRRKELCSGKPR